MVEKNQSESETAWTPITERTDEEREEMRRKYKERAREVRERKERGEFDDMPHKVSFELEYAQTLGVNCRTRAYPDKEKAREAKSKLERVECVFGARVERL